MDQELKDEINKFLDKMFELNQKYADAGESKENEKSLTCYIIEIFDNLNYR